MAKYLEVNVIGFNAGTEISIQDVAALTGIKGLDILDQMCSLRSLVTSHLDPFVQLKRSGWLETRLREH